MTVAGEKKAQGTPPGVTPAQEVLCRLVADSLFPGGDSQPLPPDTDWNAVLAESQLQGVMAIAFANRKGGSLPAPVASRIRPLLGRAMQRNARIHAQHTHLHTLLTEGARQAGGEAIPYCILKGSASAFYYPQPLLRTMGDVDFLVARSDIRRVAGLLTADSFVFRGGDREVEEKDLDGRYDLVFDKPGTILEMHVEPSGIPEGPVGVRIREMLADMIPTATCVSGELGTFMNPDRMHHGLVLLMHMVHHLQAGGFGLRHLCDWAVYAHALTEGQVEEEIQPACASVGLWHLAETVTLTAVRHIGLPRPAWLDIGGTEAEEVADALFLDILAGGNLGQKDGERVHEGLFISTGHTPGKQKSRLRQGFDTLNRMAYSRWPLTRKVKLLLPAGWVCVLTTRLCQTLTGRRRAVHVLRAYAGSRGRQELYDSLHLYQAEEPEKGDSNDRRKSRNNKSKREGKR